MKRMTMLLACLFVLSLFSATANGIPVDHDPEDILVKTRVLGERSFKLTLANLQMENTRVVLENLSGTTTYFNRVVRNHNGFVTILNLKKVPEGRYLLKIIQNNESLTQVIAVREGELLLSKVSN